MPRFPHRRRRAPRTLLQLEVLEARALLSTYVVTSFGDSAQLGSGTLRRAILDANAHAGADLIKFNLPTGRLQLFPPEIQPLSELPHLSGAVTIDGTSEPDWGQVQLDGSLAGQLATALTLDANGCHIKGLALAHWHDDLDLNSNTNEIDHNLIGLDSAGFAAGYQIGVFIANSVNNNLHDNTIAGNAAGIEIIGLSAKGNQIHDNRIGTDAAGSKAIPNGFGISVNDGVTGTKIIHNTISGNQNDGVLISGMGATGNFVQNNVIGLGAAGAAALPNGAAGVALEGGPAGNQVTGNTISGNGTAGVYVFNSDGNTIQNNRIGTDATGTKAVPNVQNGVALDGSSKNVVTQNLLSGNGYAGLHLGITAAGNANFNTITSNKIGTDITGTSALPNERGLEVVGSIANVITGNEVAGNTFQGVLLDGASGNQVVNNDIGVDHALAHSLPNQIGVEVADAGSQNMIQGNRIYFNSAGGVQLVGAGTTNNRLSANQIGFNEAAGVLVRQGANFNWIGTNLPKGGNTIYDNTGAGVAIGDTTDDTAHGNLVLGNAIYGNKGGGIDLGNNGPSPNAPDNPGNGPNRWQNYPVLTSAVVGASGLTVNGSLHSSPGGTYRLEFFLNPDGGGQGMTYVGSFDASADLNGDLTFVHTFAGVNMLAAGTHLTATATEKTFRDTSEFSTPVLVSSAAQNVVAPPLLFAELFALLLEASPARLHALLAGY